MIERIIKSKERSRKYGEVYTPSFFVEFMLDALNKEEGRNVFADDATFLDPTCGNGNILVQILRRRLEAHVPPLRALASVYGVDLLPDNVEECRERLLAVFREYDDDPLAVEILEKNVVQGNFLKFDVDFYEWKEQDGTLVPVREKCEQTF